MKSQLLRLTLLLLCLSACRSPWYDKPPEELFHSQIRRMCYKYDLELVHVNYWSDCSTMNPRDMEGMTVVYYGVHMTDVKGAREIVVDCLNTFLYTVRRTPEMQRRMRMPLTLDNFELRIDFDHFLGDYLSTVSYVGEEPEHSWIGHVLVRDGQIYYYTFRDELVVKEAFESAEEIICLAHRKECFDAECKGIELQMQACFDYHESDDESLLIPRAKPELYLEEEEEQNEGFVIEREWTGVDDDAEFDPERGFHRFDEENFMRQEDVRY